MVELNDIEMKEVEPSTPLSSAPVSKDEKKDADTLTLDGTLLLILSRDDEISLFSLIFSIDIKEQVRTIEKGVNAKEPRYILRVLRGLASTRKRLNEDVLRRLIHFYYGSLSNEREALIGFLQSATQVNILS